MLSFSLSLSLSLRPSITSIPMFDGNGKKYSPCLLLRISICSEGPFKENLLVKKQVWWCMGRNDMPLRTPSKCYSICSNVCDGIWTPIPTIAAIDIVIARQPAITNSTSSPCGPHISFSYNFWMDFWDEYQGKLITTVMAVPRGRTSKRYCTHTNGWEVHLIDLW